MDFLLLLCRPAARDRFAGEMHDCIEAIECCDRGRVRLTHEVELSNLDAVREIRRLRVAHDNADRVATGSQRRHKGSTNEPRCSGDTDALHRIILHPNGPEGPLLQRSVVGTDLKVRCYKGLLLQKASRCAYLEITQ